MRMLPLILVIAACLSAVSTSARAAPDDVPERIQGKWVFRGDGCHAGGRTIVVSATSVIFSDGRFSDVYFASDESAIRIRGEVQTYEYAESEQALVFRPEGVGTGSAFPMTRCPETAAQVTRICGWLANLTPGNWWMVDRQRTWVLSRQGDDNPGTTAVMDRVPGFDPEQFVPTGRDYGYGCACLTAVADEGSERITAIASSKRLPLAVCQADKALPAFGRW